MTRDEAIEVIKNLQINIGRRNGKHLIKEAMNMAINALEQPIPKPHDRLMYWETARRIIDSPRSKSQMLTVLDSVPPVEALERKRGKWLLDGRCSECLVAPLTSHKNFCPNCGSDMRERREDGR